MSSPIRSSDSNPYNRIMFMLSATAEVYICNILDRYAVYRYSIAIFACYSIVHPSGSKYDI